MPKRSWDSPLFGELWQTACYFRGQDTSLHLPLNRPERPCPSITMKVQTPCSDYVETSGILFFARMLDKNRLPARGQLPEGYNLGVSDPTSFDARFCRFWEIDYDDLVAKALEG